MLSNFGRRPGVALNRLAGAAFVTVIISLILGGVTGTCSAQGWWMEEPVRLVQVNLPGHMAPDLDPQELVDRIESFPANTLMLNMGGIIANYPTDLEYHVRNPHLPEDMDFFGEVIWEAHERGIRVIGRFDFSRAKREVFESNPDWFLRMADGEYAVDENGLYQTCINGGYYREYAFRILEEALERYPVDGLFFNMFGDRRGNPYTGEEYGPCRSPDNIARFEKEYGRPLPDDFDDPDYGEFMQRSASEVAEDIGALIHRIRPEAAFMTYLRDEVDIIMDETASLVYLTPSLWPHFARVNVDRARSTYPDKMIVNLVINFTSFRHRFASSPGPFTAASLYQNMAYAGVPSFTVLGTLDQPDARGVEAARAVFARHAEHEHLYSGQRNAARVVLAGRWHGEPAFRGIVEILSELHVPFVIRDDDAYLDQPDSYDLVITTQGRAASYSDFVERGGGLIVSGTTPPDLPGFPEVVRQWEAGETDGSYWRVHYSENTSALESVEMIPMSGPYAELEATGVSPLTLIPPAAFGPPDIVAFDQQETDKPGLVFLEIGEGFVAYLPWEIGQLYHENGNPTYRSLFSDLIDEFLPEGRQLHTDAHPLLEINLMRQPQEGRSLIHLVNHSGYTGTGFQSPLPMQDITISVRGSFESARVTGTDEQVPVEYENAYTTFTLPALGDYEVVVLE